MVDTRAETATIGLVAACLLFLAGAGVVHVGSRLEHEWIRLPDHATLEHRPAGGWVMLAPASDNFQVSLPLIPGPWVAPERSANPAARSRRGYRLVEPASDDRPTAREYSIVITASPEGGLLDREHPLPQPMLEALIADAATPASRILARRPLTEAGCSGYEVIDVCREARRGDVFTRRQFFWSGPFTYAFAFTSSSRADLTAVDASRFFGSITITR
jgi:hypothetical protein